MDNNFLDNDSTLYKILEWISRLAFLNLFWIFFTLLGLGVFGVMPSTLAMFYLMDKFLQGKENIKIFKEFWQQYKNNFFRINFIGIIILIIGIVLYVDLRYFQEHSGLIFSFLTLIIYLLIFFYILVVIYTFPIYLRYDLKIYYILKNALFFIFITPLETIQMVFALGLPLLFFRYLPSLIPFLGASLPMLLVSWVSNKTINKVEGKVREKK